MTHDEKIVREKAKDEKWNAPVVFGKLKQYFWVGGTVVLIVGTLVSMVVNSALVVQGAQSETNTTKIIEARIAEHAESGPHKESERVADALAARRAMTEQLAKVSSESVAARKVISEQLVELSQHMHGVDIQMSSLKEELEKSERRQVKSSDDLRSTLNLILIEMRKQ